MSMWSFIYLNHRGEQERRTIIPDSIEFVIDPGFGYQPGWFISGVCQDRKARRSFALSRIVYNTIDYPDATNHAPIRFLIP